MSQITLKKIAEHLNISIATVSRAINTETQHLVKAPTKEKILNYIKKYNFTPNTTARKLATGKSNTFVAFFKPQPYSAFFDDYYSKFIAGLVDSVSNTTYKINISLIKDELNDFDLKTAIEQTDDIAGAIFCSMGGFLKIFEENDFSQLKVPLLVLNTNISKTIKNCFHIDNVSSSYNAIKYLISKGHKKIGFVKGKEGIDCTQDRFIGYKKALKDNNINFNEKLIFKSQFLDEDGEKSIDYFFKTTDLNPSAIFFSNDSMALFALKHLKKLNISCPETVSIMGFDGLNIGRYCDPPLTSLIQPAYEMAYQGIKEIMDLIQNKKNVIGEKIFETPIIERESVKHIGG